MVFDYVKMEKGNTVMCKVSIVIPVYNVQKYIKKCLNSIRHQTYKNIEVILVDDGSTDNSGNICDVYSKKDSRFKTYHIKNGGPSKARNYGLDRVTGDYVTFVDSDDWLDKDVFEKLYNVIEMQKYDIIIYNLRRIYKNSNIEINVFEDERLILNREDIEKILLITDKVTDKNISALKGISCKIYKKELLKALRFNEDMNYCEDLCFLLQVLNKVDKIYYLKNAYYNYRARKGSVSDTYGNTYTEKNLQVLNFILDLYRNKKSYNFLNEVCFENYCKVISGLVILKGVSVCEKQQVLSHYLHNIKYSYDFSDIDLRGINKSIQIQRMLIYKRKFVVFTFLYVCCLIKDKIRIWLYNRKMDFRLRKKL